LETETNETFDVVAGGKARGLVGGEGDKFVIVDFDVVGADGVRDKFALCDSAVEI
jgi:hypothetical protein